MESAPSTFLSPQRMGNGAVQSAISNASAQTRLPTYRVLDDVAVPSWASLEQVLDEERASDNLFVGLRITGRFETLRLRAACRSAHGVPLLDAVAHQAEWTVAGATGTVVGFWSPPFSRAVAVPGLHLHFLSDDAAQAGHVLDLVASELHVELHELADVHLALPESEAFVHADLTRDPGADLDRAEHLH